MGPKKLANKFMISANTLRNYEAKELIPPAERSANGYRMYTERHEVYLACIQAMAPAFGMEVTSVVMHALQRNELEEVLWVVREREVKLYEEKASLDQLVEELNSYADGSQAYDFSQRFRIHEVSRRTGVPKSAIRYWEKSGLFTTERDTDNKYRLYNESHRLKIKMIQILQSSVYSEETVKLKQSIACLEIQNLEQGIKVAERIRNHLNNTIKHQMTGLYYLHQLIRSLDI